MIHVPEDEIDLYETRGIAVLLEELLYDTVLSVTVGQAKHLPSSVADLLLIL